KRPVCIPPQANPHRPALAPGAGLRAGSEGFFLISRTAYLEECSSMMNLYLPNVRSLSRRRFLRTVAGLTGGVLGSGFLFPKCAWADRPADPKPIPGGV